MAVQIQVRKRATLIEAFQFDGTAPIFADIITWMKSSGDVRAQADEHTLREPVFLLNTAAGVVPIEAGGWIVRDNTNKFYFMSNADFVLQYEENV